LRFACQPHAGSDRHAADARAPSTPEPAAPDRAIAARPGVGGAAIASMAPSARAASDERRVTDEITGLDRLLLLPDA
jgi:hypothetical protein